jgi:hypothetical protein
LKKKVNKHTNLFWTLVRWKYQKRALWTVYDRGIRGRRHLSQDDATAEDLYNFDASVALTEIQLDEIDAEFTEAIQEIDGERVFPFSQWEIVCKSIK